MEGDWEKTRILRLPLSTASLHTGKLPWSRITCCKHCQLKAEPSQFSWHKYGRLMYLMVESPNLEIALLPATCHKIFLVFRKSVTKRLIVCSESKKKKRGNMRTFRQFWSISSTWPLISWNDHPLESYDKWSPKDFYIISEQNWLEIPNTNLWWFEVDNYRFQHYQVNKSLAKNLIFELLW